MKQINMGEEWKQAAKCFLRACLDEKVGGSWWQVDVLCERGTTVPYWCKIEI